MVYVEIETLHLVLLIFKVLEIQKGQRSSTSVRAAIFSAQMPKIILGFNLTFLIWKTFLVVRNLRSMQYVQSGERIL